jgi:hypothetical protein
VDPEIFAMVRGQSSVPWAIFDKQGLLFRLCAAWRAFLLWQLEQDCSFEFSEKLQQ